MTKPTPFEPTRLDESIVANAEKAWAMLDELRLLPTPENYAVLFAFCEERNPSILRQVQAALGKNQMEPNGSKLANALQLIYERELSADSQEVAVEKAASKINDEMKQIMTMIASAKEGADKYGEQLDVFGAGIESAPIEQVKAMVQAMAEETRAVAEQNEHLKQQLTISVDQVSELRTNLDHVKQESLTDPLTGVGNRKAFTAELVRATNEARDTGMTLSIIMTDIDFFKKFNDKYGHIVGDQVLKLVSSTLKANVKGRDMVARWGGEEFAILLPQTPMDFAVKLGDNLRNIVAHKKIIRKPQNEDLGQITLSLGVTQYALGEDPNDFVDRADQALYRAKHEGRNRVAFTPAPDASTVTGYDPGKKLLAPDTTVTITTEA